MHDTQPSQAKPPPNRMASPAAMSCMASPAMQAPGRGAALAALGRQTARSPVSISRRLAATGSAAMTSTAVGRAITLAGWFRLPVRSLVQ